MKGYQGCPADLDEFVESYEAQRRATGRAELDDFLPDAAHPGYRQIVAELIRVDLEYAWTEGCPRLLDDYRRRFADVFEDRELAAEMAFEEFRQRRQSGESISRDDYSRKYGIDVSTWPADLPLVPAEPLSVEPLDKPDAAEVFEPSPESPAGPAERGRASRPRRPAAGDTRGFDLPGLRPGGRFAGFEIVGELGRGASARVYLARQLSLASRHVVLKVTTEETVEPDRLARLQHTNIVPIYSFHRVGPLSVICMPYFGSCMLSHWVEQLRNLQSPPVTGAQIVSTIAVARDTTGPGPISELLPGDDSSLGSARASAERECPRAAVELLQLEHSSYETVVLSLASSLAAGLAHAHDHGVLHLDLKPPNILLTDEGRPMLLDFHLATASGSARTGGQFFGGTLPYMSPEQLRALEREATVDERSDVYSFGVVLFELLTGRLPFPARTGAIGAVIREMIDDRRIAPRLRLASPPISPAAEAIVRRCLHFTAADRYQSFHELAEDLERQLSHRPLRHAPNSSPGERLRKWARRHPRLTSGAGVTAAAALILAAGTVLWYMRGLELETLAARRTYATFQEQVPKAKALLPLPDLNADELEEEVAAAHALLAHYGVLGPGDWRSQPAYQHLETQEREVLERDVEELLYLVSARAARTEDALTARRRLAESAGVHPVDHALNAMQLVLRADFRNAALLLGELHYDLPRDLTVWYLAGTCHFALHEFSEAEACFGACIALRPDWYRAYYQRGACRLKLARYSQAREDFEIVCRLRPDDAAALVCRALALDGEGRRHEAVADLTSAIDGGFPETRVYFIRSQMYERLGDGEHARRDREEGLRLVPADPRSWVSRGMAQLEDSPEAALADFRQALSINPREYDAYRNIAHVLAERLQRPEEAVKTLDRLLELTTDDPLAWSGRGVVRARLGSKAEARADARQALALRREPLVVYQTACIESLCAKTDEEAAAAAVPLLAEALLADASLATVACTDPDLKRLQNSEQFRNVVGAAQFLSTTRTAHSGPPHVETDAPPALRQTTAAGR